MAIFKTNDIEIFYQVKGNPNAKKTIAFFNGVMASTSSWSLIVPIFEKLDYRIILHDFKGQMKSSKPQGPYSFKEHCQEAKALFDYLGVESVHIVGTSYGGEVAMKFAILYPETTKSIAVIDSVSECDEVLKKFVLGWKTLCDLGEGDKFFWGMAPSIYGADFMTKEIEMLNKRAMDFKKIPSDYYEGQKILYDTFVNDVYMTDELDQIKCPSLIICGQDDLLKRPQFSALIASRIEHSEYVLLPHCGHVAIFEQAEVLKTLLLGFISKNQ